MAFGDMFRKKLGDAATLAEKVFDDVPVSLQKTADVTGDEEAKKPTVRERPAKPTDTFADIARGGGPTDGGLPVAPVAGGMTVNDTHFDDDNTDWKDPESADLERFWVN